MKPQKILWDLREVLGPNDIAISDVAAHKMWMSRMYRAERPNTCIISNGFASMGIAVPGAIAAKLTRSSAIRVLDDQLIYKPSDTRDASSTVTGQPALASRYPAARNAIPYSGRFTPQMRTRSPFLTSRFTSTGCSHVARY